MLNAKVEVGHGLKVLDKDVGCGFADVFALRIQSTQAPKPVVCSQFCVVPRARALL